MHYFITAIILILCSTLARAQSIVITFEAILNGTPTPLDSILVMNLTQGGDTTIYFPDNTLALGITGLGERLESTPVFATMPNPFMGETEIQVASTAQGGLFLMVHDASGREVASLHAAGAPGIHSFRFTAPTHGVYVLSVTQDGQRHQHRMVATKGGGQGADLRHLSTTAKAYEAKSDRSAFLWDPGDALRYIGYANDAGVVHSGAIEEVPTASVTHTFNLVVGALCPNSPTLTDIDGNIYAGVQIGDQCWMAADLKTTRYRDGSTIPNVTDNTAWTQLSTGGWCNNENDPANDDTFGKLYNWYAAANPNICPQGWHMPSDAEWTVMSDYLGGSNVGGKMKAVSPLWTPPNSGATNESGFSALPGGARQAVDGTFYGLGNTGNWWSASESSLESSAWARGLHYQIALLITAQGDIRAGYCLRCVKD